MELQLPGSPERPGGERGPHRRGLVAVALIVGLAGGVGLAAVASARRTASSFPRYLEESNATDLAVNVSSSNGEGAEAGPQSSMAYAEQAREIDGVVGDATHIGLDEIFVNETAATNLGVAVGDEIVLEARGGFGEEDRRQAPVLGREPVTRSGHRRTSGTGFTVVAARPRPVSSSSTSGC